MPSYVNKNSIALALVGLLLCAPTWAIEGNPTKRTPLCRKKEKDCTPLFYLNKNDPLDVLHQSLDQKWFKVRYLRNKKMGWVHSDDIQLAKPQGLEKTRKHLFSKQGIGRFIQGPGAFKIWRNHTLFSNAFKKEGLVSTPLKSEEILQNHTYTPEGHSFFSLERVEKAPFLLEWTEPQDGLPQVKAILHLAKTDTPVYAAKTKDSLFILGEGTGYWGKSLLVGLDAQDVPQLIIREHEDVFPFLSQDTRKRIIPDTLFLSALSPDGSLYLTARLRMNRKFVFIRVKPSLNPLWETLGFIEWPIGFPAHSLKRKSHIPLDIHHDKETSYLFIPQNGVTHLFYYGLTSAPLFKTELKNLQDYIIDQKGDLWTLQGKEVNHFSIKKGAN